MDEFKEITFNPVLPSMLVSYFDKKIELNAVKVEIDKMINSGTVAPLIFTYILTTLQALRLIKEFNIAGPGILDRIRNVIHLLYDDEEYKEKITKQLFSFVLQSTNSMSRETKSRLGNILGSAS